MSEEKLSRKYVVITSLVFAVALFSGYSTAIRFPAQSKALVDEFFGSIGFVSEMSDFSIFLFIFLNNAIKAFLVILLGFFFSLVPILFIYTNCELIGLVSGVFAGEYGLGKVVLSIAPHGLLELPAMILSASYGMWLGVCFFKMIARKETFRDKFSFAMKKYAKVILPLIFVAAIIEGFITPVFLDFILPVK